MRGGRLRDTDRERGEGKQRRQSDKEREKAE